MEPHLLAGFSLMGRQMLRILEENRKDTHWEKLSAISKPSEKKNTEIGVKRGRLKMGPNLDLRSIDLSRADSSRVELSESLVSERKSGLLVGSCELPSSSATPPREIYLLKYWPSSYSRVREAVSICLCCVQSGAETSWRVLAVHKI